MNAKKWRGACLNDCGRRVTKFNAKFCSLKCDQEHRFALRLKVFLAGRYPPVMSNAQFLHRVLRHLLGERCSRCGWAERNPVTGTIPIEVEHIDGNWENNKPGNLTLLCPNCHSLTPTFRSLNRGNGRAWRVGAQPEPGAQRPRKPRRRSPFFRGQLPIAAFEIEDVHGEGKQLPFSTADVAERLKARDL